MPPRAIAKKTSMGKRLKRLSLGKECVCISGLTVFLQAAFFNLFCIMYADAGFLGVNDLQSVIDCKTSIQGERHGIIGWIDGQCQRS